jgi:hypothetical protein
MPRAQFANHHGGEGEGFLSRRAGGRDETAAGAWPAPPSTGFSGENPEFPVIDGRLPVLAIVSSS